MIKKFLTGATIAVSLFLASTIDLDAGEMCQICPEETIANGLKYARLYNNTAISYECSVYSNMHSWNVILYPYNMSSWLVMGRGNIDWWYACEPIV